MSDGSNYLDPNRPDAVRLSVSDARALGEAALGRIGYGGDDARIITDQLIDNSLCGYRFAGLPRILAIAREARTRNARVPIAVVHETPVSALVDGGNNVGYVAVYRGAEIAIAKAKQSGVGAVGVYNSYFSGRNAYYLERIVDAGFVGLHTASGSPHIVPPGATRPALGTNPIAFGFPSADGPVIFDIGTASLMWGEVLLAAETGEALPPGLAFDADGNPTQDGRAAARGGVSAFGGHKGYGLAFAIQALGLRQSRLLSNSTCMNRVTSSGLRVGGFPRFRGAALNPGTWSRARCQARSAQADAISGRPGSNAADESSPK
jgi:L-2-hydroxycarboxylate dehydrogenase (NAD+)